MLHKVQWGKFRSIINSVCFCQEICLWCFDFWVIRDTGSIGKWWHRVIFCSQSLLSQFTPAAFKVNTLVTYVKTGPLKTVSLVTAAYFSFEVVSSIMLAFTLSDVKEKSPWLSEMYSVFLIFPRHLLIQVALGDFHSVHT